MRYPLDELLDKRAIIQLKIERIKDSSGKERLIREFEDYTRAIKEYVSEGLCTPHQIINWHKRLYETNGKTWDLEAEIRQGKEGKLGLREVGRRAIAIRENNGIRIGIKREIVEKTGVGYVDTKINHASSNLCISETTQFIE